MKKIKVKILTYSGASIRSVFQACLKTSEAPPISKLPLTATKISAPNIETVCTTSVQTTALIPPLKKYTNKL